MAKYKYVARNTTGKTVNGEISADGQNDVILKLQSLGLSPLSVTVYDKKSGGGGLYEKINESLLAMQKTVPFKDVVFFTRQMATFLNAGVSITKSIKNIVGAQKNLIFKRIMNTMYEDINAGMDFSEALKKHPDTFDQMFVSLVEAGEATGNLDVALQSLADYMEKTAKMKQAIKSAMMYPKFVLMFTVLIVFVILWKVIPIFQNLYSSMGGELPAPTKALIFLSDIVQSYFFYIIGGIIAFFIIKKYIFKVKAVNNFWDKLVINFPTFGIMAQQIIVGRLTSTLSLLLRSGTSMLQSMEIASRVASNNEYFEAMRKAMNDVKNGIDLSVAVKKTNRFEDIVIQLIETGEETGRIDDLMKKISDYYEEEVAVKIKGFSSLIEPFLIVIMGVVIGGIVVGIYLPIITMGEVMTH
ncbi:MAG: type II secretion system F family protein [Candidatus Delongbacteria bacterium]|nr:type II secretion system F family protein [Candidatus Delongbacteria bacterium]MBN2835056.1 type II secretion system F family protein [Candidatus Delongbacteria bacterium]